MTACKGGVTELNSTKDKKIGSAAKSLKMFSKNKTINSGEKETDGLDQVIWEISVDPHLSSIPYSVRFFSCK